MIPLRIAGAVICAQQQVELSPTLPCLRNDAFKTMPSKHDYQAGGCRGAVIATVSLTDREILYFRANFQRLDGNLSDVPITAEQSSLSMSEGGGFAPGYAWL